jgi:bacterioferritin (cytochrome b1)
MKNITRDTTALLNELGALLRLTRTEAQIARIRTAQARTEELRTELQNNAREADQRAAQIQKAIRKLGGTPDIFADAAGRIAAFAKNTGEQAMPFSEGLFGDLTLEHQLRDRAVFARVLAESQNATDVATLMQELEKDHTETIEWITVRLAEVAQGGTAALAPTAAQVAVGTATKLAMLPSKQGAALINKTVNLLQRGLGNANDAFESTVQKVQRNAKATGEVLDAGRDAALARAEEVAPSADVRKAAHEAREQLGTVDADELPIEGYEEMTANAAIDSINTLEDADDVRLTLRYEQAHKDRKGVSAAAEKRLTELAEESVSA